MVKNNSSNQDYTNNSDGWDQSGGTTPRKLTVTGADITLTGSGTNVYTFPSATSTLYGTVSGSITSAQLSTSLTDETGTGVAVFATSPVLVTPNVGVATATSVNKVTITAPTTSATLTLITGSSLITAGAFALTLTSTATTNATLPAGTSTLYGTGTGTITSAQLATSLTDETGTGAAVFATTPTLVTPVLGVATATSINKVTITAPATSAVLTIPNGVTLTGPAASGTAMTLGNAETISGVKTFNSSTVLLAGSTSGTTTLNANATAGAGTVVLPLTGTLATLAGTEVFTNKDLTSTTNIFPNGTVVQVVNTTASAVATGTTLIPADDTIPQSTEGDQYMTLAITPKSTTNTLVITANIFCSSAVVAHLIAALFQDSTANALNAAAFFGGTAFGEVMLTLTHTMVAGTTSATTFKIRAGGSNAGTFTFNGVGGGRFFSTIPKSSIVITEYKS